MKFNSSVLLTYNERKIDIMGKTINERIMRFCKKYPEPRQYKIELYWNRKDGRHSAVVGSGEPLIYAAWTKNMLKRSVGGDLYIQHYRYDAETKLMECSYAKIDCHTPKPNDNRRWEYAERYFIPKEEKQLYDINGNEGKYTVRNSYGNYNVGVARTFLQAFNHLNIPNDTFYPAFIALTDNNPTLPPRYCEESYYHYSWILTEWIRYNAKPYNLENGKTQQRINKMLVKELDDAKSIKAVIDYFRFTANKYYYNSDLAYFDKANMVFRLFYISDNDAKENKRVYIDGKKFLFARLKNGKWVTNRSFTSAQFNHKIVNMEDVYSLPHCEYLRNLGVDSVYKIVSIMRNFEIEQLCNMGFTDLAKRFIRSNSIPSEINYAFGEPDKKKKNVCQRYHMTKNQLEVLDNSKCFNIRAIREILNTSDLSSIDIESFKKFVKISKTDYYLRIFKNMLPEDKKKLFIRIANMSDRNENAMQIFSDIWNMANRYNIDIMNIHSYDELVRAHDTAVMLRNAEIEERNRLWAMEKAERDKLLEKKREKIDKERAGLNYDEENFLIRLPANLSEIVTEGSALHHCVGGYTDRHASGSTTIMFLRRKSEPDKPFYTIEVNNGNIVQIHGFGNRWLGNNPEAIPTVARWLKKNNIHCSEQILRGTATGYRGNNNLVPMPEI